MKKLIAILLASLTLSVSAKNYVITDHGVAADSSILNTKAIQKVIDKAAEKGGGTIVIPKGTFLTGALFFKQGTNLKLQKGAVLKGSDNIEDYPLIPSRMEGKKLDYYAALLNFYNMKNFMITGPGTVNGNGLEFWKSFWAYREEMKKQGKEATNLDCHRPRLVFIWGCKDFIIKDVNLWNSGFWTTHLYQCKEAIILNCNIQSPNKPVPAPSTDGIDLDVCKDIIIKGCYIAVNDDAIVMKGGKGPNAHNLPENGEVKDILIENCTFGPSHATLTLGSECLHGKDINMRNCKVNNNCPILKLKMRPDTYQTYENIQIENITGTCGSVIDMNPWKQFFNLEGSTEKPKAIVRNITMKNINVKANKFGVIQGNPEDSVSNIFFNNIIATVKDTSFVKKYEEIHMDNVIIDIK
jgi:polygalacturonase